MSSNVNDHTNGLIAQSPIALFCLLLLCAAAFALFSVLQVSGTEQTVFDILQTGVLIKPTMTGAEAQQYLNGALTHNQIIAAAIGWGVQIGLLLCSFSPEHGLAVMHRKYNIIFSASLASHAATLTKFRKALTAIMIGGDILTDFYYAVVGQVRASWDGWHPSLSGNIGALLVGLVYPCVVLFVTVFVGKYMFVFLDAFIDTIKNAFPGNVAQSK